MKLIRVLPRTLIHAYHLDTTALAENARTDQLQTRGVERGEGLLLERQKGIRSNPHRSTPNQCRPGKAGEGRRNRERRPATWIWIAARRAACAAEVGKERARRRGGKERRGGDEQLMMEKYNQRGCRGQKATQVTTHLLNVGVADAATVNYH
nr:unnamed protein product [Digitaria exilis]